ncbi:DUF3592 domain-containing protein [Amycolatopsis sp. NBC_00438]|uniref:DUF3592 domain-containing protein n=1 Tax=Amycolatopsis sp. NBC_00438 TaxID=2903558 RepID=UPI002E1CF448
MDPESDAEAAARRASWQRTAWELLAAVCALVFAIFVIGTAITLAQPGYLFGAGELPADAGALIGSAALAVIAWSRIVAADHRAEAALAGWAKRSGCRRRSRLTASISRRRPRGCAPSAGAVLIAVAWWWLMGRCAAGITAVGEPAGVVRETGTRTLADVVAVGASVRVEYRVEGVTRTAEIVRETGTRYAVGQVVAVVYDPAHPQVARLDDERAEDPFPVWVLIVPLLVTFFAVPWSVLAAFRWRRRYHAVRRTGWRRAAVTVLPELRRTERRPDADLRVHYHDGSAITVRAVRSTHGTKVLKDRVDRRAWIGGRGRDMVVLIPYGPSAERPYAIPVSGKVPRAAG